MSGSAARGGDFHLERSDLDFLVDFAESEQTPSLAQFFELRDELARVVGRPVDLVVAGSIRAPCLRACSAVGFDRRRGEGHSD